MNKKTEGTEWFDEAPLLTRRAAALRLFALTGLLAGCGGGNTATPSPSPSPSPTPTPSPAPGSEDSFLAQMASSMSPGTWAQLEVPGQDALLGVGSISGTMLHYCNSMPWNPVNRSIEILASDHNYPSVRHVRYDEAMNSFVLVADDAGVVWGHGYDHNCVNPANGDVYHRVYSGFSGQINVARRTLLGSTFVNIPSVAAQDQVAIGACWWSGSFSGAGSQGCLVIFNSGNATGAATDGHILAYDPLTNAWFFSQEGMSPNYGSGATYHSVIEYSAARNLAVFGGGNVAGSKLWRLNPDGSSVALASVPSGKGVGMQQGLLVDDPVTGNFLLLSAGELWELDPTGNGTWNRMNGSRTPPAEVGVPGPTNPQAVIASSISTYGVVAFITQPNQTGGNVFLYKHA